MERFCVEIAIRFLPQRLQNNWSRIVNYAWAIFLYVCDRHIHELQARNACFAVSLVLVAAGGQFKKLNTLLFLTKFPLRRDLNKKLGNICPTCREMWRPAVLTSLPALMLYFYTLASNSCLLVRFSDERYWITEFILCTLHSPGPSSICIPFIAGKLYFTLFAVSVNSNKSRKLIRFWHIFSTLTISKYFIQQYRRYKISITFCQIG